MVAVRRLPVVPTLVACSVLLAAVTATIHQLPVGSTRDFALACALFGFVWLFMLPFHIGLAFRADPSGRLAGLVPAAQLLGSAFGPLTASFIVESENAAAVPLLSAGFAIAAAVLVLATRPHGNALQAGASSAS
jgi:DHA1 family inner membrane transport protein